MVRKERGKESNTRVLIIHSLIHVLSKVFCILTLTLISCVTLIRLINLSRTHAVHLLYLGSTTQCLGFFGELR